MADARPTLVHGAAIYAQRSRTVQPPDDRTYSAEVTSFPSNLLHHRSVRIAFPIARRYDTTPFPHCQAQFRGKSQNVGLFLGQKGDLAVCAVRRYFGWIFHGIVKLLKYFVGKEGKTRRSLLPGSPGFVDIFADAKSIYFLAEIRYIALRFDMI